MKHITKPSIAFAAFMLLASCEIVGPKPGPQAIAAANQIATDITLHRATAGLGTELSDPALAIFARVFEKVREDYVRAVTDTALLSAARAGLKKAHPDPKGADYGVLVMAAIDGMLGSLDRYSTYLDPSDLKAMRDRIRGQFGGLGIKVRKHNEGLTVVAPIDGTPAYRAGLSR